MLKNRYFYRKNFECFIRGFIVPKEFISGRTLAELERILGFKQGRLKQGAAFAKLFNLPDKHELAYFGSTETAAHHFAERREELRNQGVDVIGHHQLNEASYHYLNASTQLIKVIPLKDHNPLLSEDENWPSGAGAMQYKLVVTKPAMIIDVIEDYPNGKFK